MEMLRERHEGNVLFSEMYRLDSTKFQRLPGRPGLPICFTLATSRQLELIRFEAWEREDTLNPVMRRWVSWDGSEFRSEFRSLSDFLGAFHCWDIKTWELTVRTPDRMIGVLAGNVPSSVVIVSYLKEYDFDASGLLRRVEAESGGNLPVIEGVKCYACRADRCLD